jgi:hypothetical protein
LEDLSHQQYVHDINCNITKLNHDINATYANFCVSETPIHDTLRVCPGVMEGCSDNPLEALHINEPLEPLHLDNPFTPLHGCVMEECSNNLLDPPYVDIPIEPLCLDDVLEPPYVYDPLEPLHSDHPLEPVHVDDPLPPLHANAGSEFLRQILFGSRTTGLCASVFKSPSNILAHSLALHGVQWRDLETLKIAVGVVGSAALAAALQSVISSIVLSGIGRNYLIGI